MSDLSSVRTVGRVRRGNSKLRIACAADGRKNWEIAQAAEIPASNLSGYKSGAMVPTDAIRERIATVLGVCVEDLFSESDDC